MENFSSKTMKAVIQTKHGDRNTLELGEVDMVKLYRNYPN